METLGLKMFRLVSDAMLVPVPHYFSNPMQGPAGTRPRAGRVPDGGRMPGVGQGPDGGQLGAGLCFLMFSVVHMFSSVVQCCLVFLVFSSESVIFQFFLGCVSLSRVDGESKILWWLYSRSVNISIWFSSYSVIYARYFL